MNEYKSLYLRDLLGTIDRVAIETMLTPCMAGDPEQTPEELAAYNNMVASNNEGIRDFVNQLRTTLMEDDHDG
jgi:hypothetical protein